MANKCRSGSQEGPKHKSTQAGLSLFAAMLVVPLPFQANEGSQTCANEERKKLWLLSHYNFIMRLAPACCNGFLADAPQRYAERVKDSFAQSPQRTPRIPISAVVEAAYPTNREAPSRFACRIRAVPAGKLVHHRCKPRGKLSLSAGKDLPLVGRLGPSAGKAGEVTCEDAKALGEQ